MVRQGVLVESVGKIAAADGVVAVYARPFSVPFRFDRLDFGDQVLFGINEISKRWKIERYLIGPVEFAPEHIATARPIVTPAQDLVVQVRYLGPTPSGEHFHAQASGEVIR
jgi:hypothetical protein